MPKNILVSVDLAEKDAFDRLMPVAESIGNPENAKLHVLSVIPNYTMPIVGSYFPEGQEKKTLDAAKQMLRDLLATRTYAGEMKGHIAHGTIYDEIMKAADSLGCDLIVMASHRPELKDYLLGPNAARVVRHANQSVYVVRHGK